ncbi:MAG: lysophospholipid acyltransferase family protein [Lentimicrobiaceae bacterium]|nr:lysophospholipid acyltransferase family protein [Lentimicrobiaceae bacterium]
MKWHQRLGAGVIFILLRLLSLLPFRLLYLKASVFRWIGQHLIGYRKQVIIQNLARAFPKAGYTEIKRLTHDFYRNFFDVFVEVIKSVSLSEKEYISRFQVTNPELIASIHKEGKNTIVLSGHTGNWEYMKFLPHFMDFSCHILYKPLSKKVMDAVTNRVRAQHGVKLLEMNHAVRYLLSKKDFPAMYVFIADQSPHHRDPDYVFNFLNQPSFFFTGGIKIARTTSSALLYIEILRLKRGHYSATFHLISKDASEESGQALMQKYVHLLENNIHTQPASWLWSHKRWKHPVNNSQTIANQSNTNILKLNHEK